MCAVDVPSSRERDDVCVMHCMYVCVCCRLVVGSCRVWTRGGWGAWDDRWRAVGPQGSSPVEAPANRSWAQVCIACNVTRREEEAYWEVSSALTNYSHTAETGRAAYFDAADAAPADRRTGASLSTKEEFPASSSALLLRPAHGWRRRRSPRRWRRRRSASAC